MLFLMLFLVQVLWAGLYAVAAIAACLNGGVAREDKWLIACGVTAAIVAVHVEIWFFQEGQVTIATVLVIAVIAVLAHFERVLRRDDQMPDDGPAI
jgi:hypothetical protein